MTGTAWLPKGMTGDSTSYSQAHKGKQKSSEYPGLWHNSKFSFRIGNSDEIIPLQDQLLPPGISFQLQREALANQRGEEEGSLMNGAPPRAQQHVSIPSLMQGNIFD